MMMQHDKFEGSAIALGTNDRFEDRMRRIREGLLSFAQVRAADDSPWFAIRVMSGREKAVKNSLDDHEIEALVPMRKGPEYRRRGRIMPVAMIPVMTSYVLIRFVPTDEAFLAMRGIEHVVDVLGGCSSPRYIPHTEVIRFKTLADEGSLDWEKPTTVFRKGEKVRVDEGLFASFTGEVISCRSDGKGDAVVELEIMSRMTPVLMPLAILRKL